MICRCFGCFLLALSSILAIAGAGLAAGEELSRIGLVGEMPRTARRLAAADELAAQQKWADAVDEYQRILSEAGEDLVAVDARHCLQARRLCHLRLAALPPAALRIYRNRVDSQAKKWLDEGTARRDRLHLARLVDETFCSRSTDLALDLLGDLAFERGSFEEAERWWRMLALPASERGGEAKLQNKTALIFPDPQVDLARVRAKQFLVRLFRGERTGLQQELRVFRVLHATAKGQLAGREGIYADIVQALAEQQETLAAPATATAWPTFGGNPSRNFILPKPPGRWAKLGPLDGPLWTVRLDAEGSTPAPRNDEESAGKVVPVFQAARSLAFHPIIHGNRVFVANARRVKGYNLLDGREILRYDVAGHVSQDLQRELLRLKLDLPAEPELSYTLSVAGNRIYARLGAQALGPPRKDGPNDPQHTYLVCLDLQFDVSGKVERWKVVSKGTAATGPVFEGAPVVGQGGVFIAESRFAGGQAQTAIACYDASTGAQRWQSDVCSVTQDFRLEEGKQRFRHHLLTLAGSTLFYCSHSGAIVALDALTGRRLWAIRYPSQARQTIFGEIPPRDLAPGLSANGRLYVAPIDSDRIFCLDPDTGNTIWESGPVQVIHMLGVAKGRLIFTATTPRPCIRAVEAATGKDLREWMQPREGTELKTFGRGVLAGDWVFWPIRSDWRRGVYVLDQETGEPVLFDEKINGNLAVGGDCLAVAGPRELSVYVPEGRLLQRRREEAAQSLGSSKARYRLALAKASAELYADALADLDRLEAETAPEERLNGTALHSLIGMRRHEFLLDAAELAQQSRQWEQAAIFLTQAAGEKFPPFARLAALGRQAMLWTRAGRPERAVAVWQSILENAALSGSILVSADGSLHAAASLARERIDELIQAHSPAVYDAVEQRARMLLAAATRTLPSRSGQESSVSDGTQRKEILDQLSREFPNAAITRATLLELAQLHEHSGQIGPAAKAYRELLRSTDRVADRARARAGLARAYERQRCWSAARETWQQLVAEEGDRTLPTIDRDRPVRDFVAQQLRRAEYQSVADSHRHEVHLPLVRSWQSSAVAAELDGGERFLRAASGPWHATGEEYLFSVCGCSVICREGLHGKRCWQSTLPQQPRWIDHFADMVVVAGADSVYGLSRAEGIPLWSLCLTTSDKPAHVTAFQLAGPRLFFLQGERRLVALDVFSGRVLWSRWAPAGRLELPFPSGRFRAVYHAGQESVVIQAGSGSWLVFDSRTGQKLRESDRTGSPWSQPPLPLDEQHICLQTDPGQLTVLDSRSGEPIWTFGVENPVSLTGEALQVLGNWNNLLVLVPRNYGYFLECLDPRTGSRRWLQARFLGRQPVDLAGGTLDDTAAYMVQDNLLLAHALANGQLLWKQALPAVAAHWQTLRAHNSLITLPRMGQGVQWQFRWLAATVRMRLTFPPAAEATGSVPVLVSDLRTGRLMQRLNFPVGAPRALVACRLDPMPVMLPRLERQLLELEDASPAVKVSEGGLMVQWDGQASGIASAPRARP